MSGRRRAGGTDAAAIRKSERRPVEFEVVVERHFAAIYRYLRRRVGPDHAEDLVAETFTRAFRSRGTYDTAVPGARPWLFGIATHLLNAHLRRELRPAAVEPPSSVVDEAAASNARLDATAAFGAHAKAIRALPAEQREVLLLVAVAELTYEETGRALGIPIGTVRSRMSRARAELLAHLPPEGVAP